MASTSTENEFSGWVNPFASDSQPADEFSGWVNPFETAKPTTGPVNAVADIGVSVASGANMMLELAGSLYGLTTGDMENAVRTYGAKGREFWESKKSPYLKQLEADRRAKVDAAEGEWAKLGTAAWTTLTSPSLLASYTAEQLPNLLVTGGAGTAARAGLIAGARVAGKEISEKAANRAALGGAIGAGGVMQGSDVGASAYDQLMALPDEVWLTNPDFQSRINGNMDLLPRVKREMAAELSKDSAIIATAASIGINSIPVFRMLEERLVGIPGAGGRLAGAGKGFVGESLGEGLEEGSGAMLSNLAPSRVDPNQSLMAGVGEAAGMGLAAGPLGAIGGALRRPEVDSAREADVARTIFEAPTIDESIAAASEALTTMEMPGVDFVAPEAPAAPRPGYDTIPGSGIPIIEFDATGLPFLSERPTAPGSQMQGIDFRTQRDDETDAAYAIRMEQEQARRDQDFPAAIEQKEEQDAIRAELSPAAAPANPAIANALLGAYVKEAPEITQEAQAPKPATAVLAAVERLAAPVSVRTVTMPSGNPFPSEKIAKSSMSYRNNPGARIVPAPEGKGVVLQIPEQEGQAAEWRTFTPETGTLNVPRETMPQIKAEHRGAMVNFLKGRFISSETQTVPADTLKPTQAEFSPAKVKQALEYEGGNRSILVSSDNYVVDGHHQWLASLDGDIQVIRIDAPIKEILEVIQEFPSATTGEATPAGNYSKQLVDFAKKAKSLAEVRQFAAKQFGPRAIKALDQAITGAWNIRNQEQRRKIKDSDTIAVAVAKLGGIKPEYQQDITGDTTINKMVPGIGQVFSKTGTSPDDMALKLLEEGYITQAQYDNMDGRDTLYEALNDDLSGRRKVYRIDSLKAQEEMLQELENQYEAEEQALQSRREQLYAEIEQEYGAEAAERARLYDDAQDNTTDDLLSDIDNLNQLNQERDDARETDNEPGITFDEATGNREPIRPAQREAQRQPAKAEGSEAQDRRAEPAVAAKPAAKEENPNPKITIQIAADSIEKLRAQDVERVISEAFGIGEDHLFDVYMYIANNRSDLQQALRDAFDDVAPFLTESGNRMLSVMAQNSVRRTTGESEKRAILDKYGDDLSGLQLSSNDGERFVLFTPEAGEPGKVRATYFFERGFSGHSTRSSYAKLLDEMFQEGYRKEVPGKLEELSQTKEFVDGNEYASMIQKVNSGQMTYREMMEVLENRGKKPAEESQDGDSVSESIPNWYSVESKKKPYNANQADLFAELESLSNEDPYSNTETRPGTVDKQKQAGRSALRDFFRWLTAYHRRARPIDGGGSGDISLLGASMYKGLYQGDPVSLVGKTVRSPRDVAAVAQVYRDPRFETLRAIYTDDNGLIIHQEAASTRMPASVMFEPITLERMGDTANAIGASKVYLLHNHPSGSAEPSFADQQMTQLTASFLGSKFASHVVIDTNQYSVIDRDGMSETFDDKTLASIDHQGDPEVPHDAIGLEIPHSEALALMAPKIVQNSNAVVLITKANGQIGLVTSVPMSLLRQGKPDGHGQQPPVKFLAALRRLTRAGGLGGRLFVVLPKNADASENYQWMHSFAQDVVDHNGNGKIQVTGGVELDNLLGNVSGSIPPRRKMAAMKEKEAPYEGSAGPREPKAMYSRGDEKSLYVAHNLTAENLRHADEIGGLAAPSLAIADIEKGAFDSFGEITLLADPSITQTRGARTFNADVYSPRHPRAQIRIKQKEYNDLIDRLDAATGDMRFLENPSMDEIESHGARALAGNSAFMYAHLKDKGVSVRPARDTKTDPAIRKAAALIEKLPYSSKYEWYNNTSNPDLQKMAEDHYREINDKYAAARGKDLGFFEDDGTLSVHLMQRFVADATRYAKSKGIDSTATKAAIAKKFRSATMSNDLEQEAGREFNKLLKDRVIFKGFTNSGNRRYAAYNMDNILAEMTKTIRGGEGFNYGAGSIRSKYASEIKSIQEIKNRKSELVPQEEMEAIKKESQDKLFEAMDALKPYYKYDTNSFGYYDDAANAIAEGRSGLREAFKSSPAVDRIAADIISYLKNLPTQYFETKMQRAVGLNEFKTAIVPRGASQDVIGILEKNGVSVRYYKPGDKDSRVKAIKAEKDILFSKRQPTARRSVIPLGRAQTLVSSITSRFENAPDVIVVQNMNDEQVPEAVRQADAEQRSQGAKGDPEGFYYKGKAYIVLDGVSLKRGETAEQAVLRVFSHEVLGHAGLRGLFRGDLEKVLLEVAIKRRDDVRRKAQSYGLDIADRADRMTAAEEVLAELAQSQPESSLVAKAIEAVRRALRRMLMRLPAEARQMLGGSKFIEWVNSMTDAEIIDRFIVPAREFIRGGKEAALDAMPSFVRSGGTWYRSDLQQNIGQIRQMANKQGVIGKDQAKQWIDAAIKKGLFKAEEVEWTGLKEFIDTAGDKVSVEDIQAFADSNGVQVEDVVLGDTRASRDAARELAQRAFSEKGYVLTFDEHNDEEAYYDDPEGDQVDYEDLPKDLQDAISKASNSEIDANAGAARYANHQLPGGENYREVLLTLPVRMEKVPARRGKYVEVRKSQANDEFGNMIGAPTYYPVTRNGEWAEVGYPTREEAEAVLSPPEQNYSSSHWDKPNVLAHIRMNDRTDADGNKVLFIEEIQSDFAQDTRKQKLAMVRSVKENFDSIVDKMKASGVLEVNCD